MTTQRVSFAGKIIETTVTTKASVAENWVSEIRSRYIGVVGLGYKWMPRTRPGRNRNEANATTLQLCIDDKCLILQLLYMDYFPQSLKDFLNDPFILFVGVDVGYAVQQIRDKYGLKCGSKADIREMAKFRWPGRFRIPGLKYLASEVVGLEMDKPMHVAKSNWENRELTMEQIEYACIDAYASYRICHKLIKEIALVLMSLASNNGNICLRCYQLL